MFFFLAPDTSIARTGNTVTSYFDSSKIKSTKVKIDGSSEYSNYVKFLLSLKADEGDKIPEIVYKSFKGKDIFKVKCLNTNQTQYQMAFNEAVVYNFHNGFGKEFCDSVSFLCSFDLLLCKFLARDTLTDHFRLLRINEEKKPTNKDFKFSNHPMYDLDHIPNQPHSYQYGQECGRSSKFSSITSHMVGNCTADMVVTDRKNNLPIVIFECKSNAKISTLESGIIQLASYGLSLQHKRKLLHAIKLVLITPRSWYVGSLQPYQTNISEISFINYIIFKKEDKETYFDREAYIEFLLDLRQHFESISHLFSSEKK